jgi:Ca-activated chloride channel family protein
VPESERPDANLVFLVDVSGSMSGPNKLSLVKDSVRMLVDTLKPTDRVAIVTYAGSSSVALPSTLVAGKAEIMDALDHLAPTGQPSGPNGLELAYQIAGAHQVEGGTNRVILCTDGDFNDSAVTDPVLSRLIQEKAKAGVYLSVLGFGEDNFKDGLFEKMADRGSGYYGFIDSPAEARKLLVEQTAKTLIAIAKEVKVQVQFNPALAESYRLIGYENRYAKKEDFEDEAEGGAMGAGDTVTALYEVVPVAPKPPVVTTSDPLKFAISSRDRAAAIGAAAEKRELLTVKVRYKEPTVETAAHLEYTLVDTGATFAAASQDFKFAAAVAGFGMLLRESPQKGAVTYDNVISWAQDGQGADDGGYRHDFIELVKKAKTAQTDPKE